MVLKNMFQHVVIIEKSKIIRDGIFSLLTSHKVSKAITVLKDFEEWTVALGEKKPDVVILNHNLSKEDIKKIKSKYNLPGNTLFVAIIYDYYLPEEISELFDEVIFITDSEETFVNKFHRLSKNKDDHFDRDERERLTDREKDVLRLLVQGFSNKEVAEQLAISPHTVITHRKNIIEKTGIRSLAGLAVYAILNNIAEIGDLKG